MKKEYVLVSKYSIAAFIILSFFLIGLTLLSVHKLKKYDSEMYNKIITCDVQIQTSIDSLLYRLQEMNKDVSDSAYVANVSHISTRLSKCEKDIDTHKITMEAELDNELNKITIWITIIIIVFGLLNIGISIGNHISASNEVDRIAERVENQYKDIQTEVKQLEGNIESANDDLKLLWDINDFDFRNTVRRFNNSPDQTCLRDLLNNLLETCKRNHNENNINKIRTFINHVYDILFKNNGVLKIDCSDASFLLLEELHTQMSSFLDSSNVTWCHSLDKLKITLKKVMERIEKDKKDNIT